MDAGPLLTVREAALELNCSPDTVRRRVASGELQAVQLGGRGSGLRIPASALEEFVYGEPEDDAA